MADPPPGPGPKLAIEPDEASAITPAHVLCVSTSMKPAPGSSTPSACRNLLVYAARLVAARYPPVRVLDLRATPLPWFDGRLPAEMPHDPAGACHQMVSRSGALFLAIPGYWRAVGGCFKNFVEVLSGPAYDERCLETAFSGKAVGYFVVGADDDSAIEADRQARAILAAVGARVTGAPVILGNPAQDARRLARDAQRIVADLGSLVREVVERSRAAG